MRSKRFTISVVKRWFNLPSHICLEPTGVTVESFQTNAKAGTEGNVLSANRSCRFPINGIKCRLDSLIVDRTFHSNGKRCRDCEQLEGLETETCSACGSNSCFEVDLVNEIVELVKQSGGEIDLADPIDTLSQAGSIGALIRYKIY